MAMQIVRTDEEINALLDECAEQIDEGGTQFRGKTYEEGIYEAIRWLTEKTAEHPTE